MTNATFFVRFLIPPTNVVALIRGIRAKNRPFIKNRPVENLEIFKISIQFRKLELKIHAEGF